MRLIVKDMITITSVRAAMLRPGEEIEVSETEGRQLLTRHPGVFCPGGDDLFVQPDEAAKPKRAKRSAQEKEKPE